QILGIFRHLFVFSRQRIRKQGQTPPRYCDFRSSSDKQPRAVVGVTQSRCPAAHGSFFALPSPYNHGSVSGKTSASVLPDCQNSISSSRLASQSVRISSLMKAVKSVPTPSPYPV